MLSPSRPLASSAAIIHHLTSRAPQQRHPSLPMTSPPIHNTTFQVAAPHTCCLRLFLCTSRLKTLCWSHLALHCRDKFSIGCSQVWLGHEVAIDVEGGVSNQATDCVVGPYPCLVIKSGCGVLTARTISLNGISRGAVRNSWEKRNAWWPHLG